MDISLWRHLLALERLELAYPLVYYARIEHLGLAAHTWFCTPHGRGPAVCQKWHRQHRAEKSLMHGTQCMTVVVGRQVRLLQRRRVPFWQRGGRRRRFCGRGTGARRVHSIILVLPDLGVVSAKGGHHKRGLFVAIPLKQADVLLAERAQPWLHVRPELRDGGLHWRFELAEVVRHFSWMRRARYGNRRRGWMLWNVLHVARKRK